jgi:hypothetical protein
MDSILFFDYCATGEGRTIEIFYTNSYRVGDEDAAETWKSNNDSYFHEGLQLIPLDAIEDNVAVMDIIRVHTPALYEYINSKRDYLFKCDYKAHYNYS